MKAPMGPPPPRFPNPSPNPNPKTDSEPSTSESVHPEEAQGGGHEEKAEANQGSAEVVETEEREALENPKPGPDSAPSVPRISSPAVPYTIPPWSEHPGHPFFFEVLKDGIIVEQLDVSEKGAYMFGRIDLCDFVLEHPTISRFHAVLQFKKDGEVFLYDVGSIHGTFVNKSQVKKRVYTEVHVGDVIRFGQSSRLYVFQGPSELMPPESDLKKIRNAKIQEVKDREASLADGISWGMSEDAIQDDGTENDADEMTWQTYKGQLTERQEKTRGKIIKRMEKVANMRKEIDAIRVKDIPQGGLTQGQQTQIARNEQRMSQILEELESLEETLNESIQESIGARKKVIHAKKKGTADDEDEILSDEDDFYDRTKKVSLKKSAEKQSVETADTLLDKKDLLIKEMEEKTNLLREEKAKMVPESEGCLGEGDDLDAYMTGLSARLAFDKTEQIGKELSTLQSELGRILFLLKIADPNGEAAKKRDAKMQASKANYGETSVPSIPKPAAGHQRIAAPEKSVTASHLKEEMPHSLSKQKPTEEVQDIPAEEKKIKPLSYTVSKPQWLGAVKEVESIENPPQENVVVADEADQFVDYKDRKKVLASVDDGQDIEHAAPGLIMRKRKHVGKSEMGSNGAPDTSTSLSEAESKAADAVALLLKHTRGYLASHNEIRDENQGIQEEDQPQNTAKIKRVIGPERPAFLDCTPDYESWVPPEGQSGDGRTSLNDRLGY